MIQFPAGKFDLRSLQSVVGEPMYPSGQVHLGVWLMTLQMAVGAHGLPTAHGLMHCLFWHAGGNVKKLIFVFVYEGEA